MINNSKYVRLVIGILSLTSMAGFAFAQMDGLYTGSYSYPDQPGKGELEESDPLNQLLTDGKTGSHGPLVVWGKWDVKSAVIDWAFDDRVRITKIITVINHPEGVNPGASHPDRVKLFVGDDKGTFSDMPNATMEIPFEEGPTQTVTIAIPDGGIVAKTLRAEFISDHHQVALCEVRFEAVPTTDPISAAIANKGSYSYPDQPGKEELDKSDPRNLLLTDGKTGTLGTLVVWGKWAVKSAVIDWNFPDRVRITKISAVINHPEGVSLGSSHPDRVKLFVADDKGTFSETPNATMEIPFEEGPTQTVTIAIPDGGIVARTLRTEFVTDHQQVALCEVRFEAAPTTDSLSVAIAEVEPADPVVSFLQAPRPLSREQKKTPFFGVCGHMLHTTGFLQQFSKYWEPEFTIPLVAGAGIDWVREPLYQGFFSSDDVLAEKPNKKSAKENRDRIEKCLAEYDRAGIAVLLAPMYGKATDPGVPSFARWVGELAARHPCVRAIELHNEPNLKGFWRGTPKEFVAASEIVVKEIKKNSPEVPIIAGSFSGWGSVWDRPDLKELVEGPKEISTLWAEKAFEEGLLNLADGVSSHPYRGASAPEGGDVNEDRLDPDGFEKEITSWLEICRKYAPGKPPLPFYITEIGYSVTKTKGYSQVPDEERQADYLSRLMLLCLKVRMNGVPLMGVFWYDLKQDETDYEYEANFGLVSKDTARLRPGYLVYRRIAESFPDVLNLANCSKEYTFATQPEKIKSFSWKSLDTGNLSVAFWRMNQLQKKDRSFSSELVITLPDGFRLGSVELTDLNEDRPRLIGFKVGNDGKVRIPLWVTARAAWITLRSEAGASTAI